MVRLESIDINTEKKYNKKYRNQKKSHIEKISSEKSNIWKIIKI
jgi:hypothetical protein